MSLSLVAVVLALPVSSVIGADLETSDTRTSSLAPPRQFFEIRGTGNRNNPFRQKLEAPFSGEQLFVEFRLRYAAESIDTPEQGGGEFLVLWLDANEGGDTASHNGGIPNLGVHVHDGKNRFMVRYSSSRERFSNIELAGDRDHRIVGRLWKTRPDPKAPFDNLDLWINPLPTAEFQPDASTRSAKSVSTVNWVGFSTGRKTESTDRIAVSKIRLATTWAEALGLPESLIDPGPDEPPAPPVIEKTVSFAGDIHPLLKDNCFKCHSGESPKSKVRLDVADEMLNQVSLSDPDSSPLLRRVTAPDPEKRMPPPEHGDRLDESQVGKLRAWIGEGMEWDERLLPTPKPKTDHWAFQPIRRPEPPKVGNQAWVRTPVDAFIARKHEQLGLAPAPEADHDTLVRRLSLDLHGTPPPPGLEVTDFDAHADELLYDRAYGERWGRHWLDLARWAESNGHQHNRERPHAWRYRDYVIRSFNQDKPFDRFVREQLAGDELPYSGEHLVATGFLSAARYSGNEQDKRIQRNDILVDVVNTTSKTFLGLTVECAQCHTHKFDPISIRDYYRLQAFFAKGQPGNVVLSKKEDEHAERLVEQRWRLFDAVHRRMVEARRKKGYPEPILVTSKNVIKGMTSEEKRVFDRLEKEIADLPQVWGWYSPATASTPLAVAPHTMRWPLPHQPEIIASQRTHLLIRGDVGSRGPEVEPGWPAVFGTPPALDDKPRTHLAEWLTSPDNPLTARVWVNRIWQWHFGTGLVETSGDFGTQGSPPSHPDLLDWLAGELIDSGWSTRHIHRLILHSNTYRQSSAFSAAQAEIDPGNSALWRWEPRRLEAEAIRDSILAVAGRLDTESGGPSVPLEKAELSNRRSIYLEQKRDRLPHQQMLFDGANAITSCSLRRVSTVSLQPLYLLNSEFMQRMAAAFAERVSNEAESPEARAQAAIRLALGRNADQEELARTREFIAAQGLEAFCLTLVNLNEFLYVP